MLVGATVFCVTDDEYYRLRNQLAQRLHHVTGPTAECERIYDQAIRNGNVNVAAIAAVMLADAIHVCRLEGWEVVDPGELDEGLARMVRTRLLRNQETATVEEAAALLGCTPQHVRRLVRAGRITGRRTPHGSWRCSVASVTTYKKSG
jgi:excisionase family DNA binding protein